MLIVEVVVTGFLLGGLYACLGMGFSVIWGVTNLINLAHGSMTLMGAYITWLIVTHTGVDPFLTVPVSAAVLFALGYTLQKALFNRLLGASLFMTLILTFGFDMVLTNVNLALFTADVRSITVAYSSRALEFGGMRVPYTRLLVFAAALLLTLLLHVYMNHTRIGAAIRATAQNGRAASVLGIEPRDIYAVAFGLGAAMAGAAGALMTVLYSFSPVMGASLTMKAFVVVLLGGLGSMHGAIVAGILLGVCENVVSGLIAPGYREAVSFFVLLLVLLLRPRGLFGNRYLADPRGQ